MLEVEEISINFKNFSLGPISFNMKKEKRLVIMGKSGSGKTTLLKTILGILVPDRGRIILNGKDITYLPPQKRKMAIVTQDPLLFPHLKVEDNVSFGIISEKKDKKKYTEEIMKIVHISHLRGRMPKTLSGGEKQRVAIARALFIQPELLLLDEPFSSLDEELRNTMRDEVLRLQKELNFSMILVTHNKKEAQYLGERIVFLENGRILS